MTAVQIEFKPTCEAHSAKSPTLKTRIKIGGWQSPSCHFCFHQTDSRLVDTVYKDVDRVLTPVSKCCDRVTILTAPPRQKHAQINKHKVIQQSDVSDWALGALQL